MTDDRARIDQCLSAIDPIDDAAWSAAATELDGKLKPPGSLGRLEQLACQVAAVRGLPRPGPPTPAVVVCAADHGVAAEGTSAYPAEVTSLMMRSFTTGGAAVCVLAREVGARLVVADLGVNAPPAPAPAPAPGDGRVRDLRVRPGTANSAQEPAMTLREARRALRHGIDLADELVDEGIDLVALGEMGIGNTTTASALTAALLDCTPAEVCGRGTGLDEQGLRHKKEVVARILARHREARDPWQVLAALGGLEVAALTGVLLGCAARRVPVVLDGFITGAAALVARDLAPAAVGVMLAGHLSPEPGHARQLESLGLRPILSLDMRLGEGSGATLALGVVRAALAVLDEMAGFDSLGLGAVDV